MTMHPDEINQRGQDTWNLVTNMKNKKNSQGTLFSGGTDQRTPESRQPRGYSPERLREVQAAAWASPIGGLSATAGTPNGRMYVRQLHETLARSTASTEDMHKAIFAVDQVKGQPGAAGLSENANGDFHRFNPTAGRLYGKINIRSGRERTSTVIHELGHAVSASEGNELSYEPDVRGQEEGRADKYADMHSKKPGYKRRPDVPIDYPEKWHSGYGVHSENDQHEFNSGYYRQRQNWGPTPKWPSHLQESLFERSNFDQTYQNRPKRPF